MTKEERFAKHAEKRRKKIAKKDAEKMFKHEVFKDGKGKDTVWVIRQGGTELRNKDKKAVIYDWYTINGYSVE